MQEHVTSARELDDLRAVVARDLADAEIRELSDDRRFATAYNAALQLSKMVISCAGYRVTGIGHHRNTFEALSLAMGPEAEELAAYFEVCRRKRNMVDYDLAYVATESEADDLLAKTHAFQQQVERWIAGRHPEWAVPEEA